MARAAGISIINFEEQVFTNYLGNERLIIHKGLSHWNPSYLKTRWTETVIAALGNATYQTLKSKSQQKANEEKAKALARKKLVDKKRTQFLFVFNQSRHAVKEER